MTAGRAVFLDRDGVLNRPRIGPDDVSRPPQSLDELEILPGVDEACRDLRALGLRLIVVTNQPDVARGTQTREVVVAINDALARALPLDAIYVCFHDDANDCECRKPKPGLLLSAARDWGIDLSASFLVGDRWSDIEAGKRAGCTTILIDDNRSQAVRPDPSVRVDSLASAVPWIRDHGPVHAGGGKQ